jgi:hypothetical protein
VLRIGSTKLFLDYQGVAGGPYCVDGTSDLFRPLSTTRTISGGWKEATEKRIPNMTTKVSIPRISIPLVLIPTSDRLWAFQECTPPYLQFTTVRRDRILRFPTVVYRFFRGFLAFPFPPRATRSFGDRFYGLLSEHAVRSAPVLSTSRPPARASIWLRADGETNLGRTPLNK